MTPGQRQALAVLAAAHCRPEPRPVRVGDRTAQPGELAYREMLTIHHRVAKALVFDGLVHITNDVLRTLELTPEGRARAREMGL